MYIILFGKKKSIGIENIEERQMVGIWASLVFNMTSTHKN